MHAKPHWLRHGVFLLALLVLAACNPDDKPGGTQQHTDPLSQADGKWLFINYWAEWCKPCIEEIPELNEFARLNADRVLVLMVNYDGASGDALREQAARLGIETALLEHDPASRFGFDRPLALPSTFVLSPDGTLHTTLLGPQNLHSLAAAMETR